MINASTAFREAITQPVKETYAFITRENGSRIQSDGDLINIKISAEGGLCKTVMRKCEARFLGEHFLLGEIVKLAHGVKCADNSLKYISHGSFLITETTTDKETGITTVAGYDLMIQTMQPYQPQFTYPCTMLELAIEIGKVCGFALGTTNFLNKNLVLEKDLYENISGITYRDILQEIAEASASTCMMSYTDTLTFARPYKTNEKLTYENLKKLKVEPLYGEINSVVLSRQPQEDNVVLIDEESVKEYGLTEFKICNNEILDKRREEVLPSIYNALLHTKFTPFEADTEFLGWYQIGDVITIENDTGETFETTIYNASWDFGGTKEKLYTRAETKTETNYKRSGGLNNRIKNTEIIVDKQEQYIKSIVSDIEERDGVVNENFTNIYQDIENIVNAVQNSGGNNLLRNSAMFAYDNDGLPTEWEVTGTGTLSIQASTEATASGSVSGNTFTLNNKTVSQKITVKQDNQEIPEDKKNYYTFSCKVKKAAAGTGYIKIFNQNESYILDFPNGEAPFYGDYEIKALLPSMNAYTVEIYGSEGSDFTLTDCMFALGKYRSAWTQANGEIMNTQVNINVNGVLVRSSVYAGDYTVMSPLEFSGYSVIHGVKTRVFSLNKDVTEVKKLKIHDELTMPPLKIVPVTSGNINGWAVVPSE